MQIKKFDNLHYLVILLPLAIVSGPLIPDLIISLVSLYFLIFHFDKIKIFYNKYTFLKILIIFCFINILISLFSENILLSVKNSITYLRFPLFLMAICFFSKNKDKLFLYIYIFLFLTILVLCLDAFLQYFSGKNILGYVSNSRNRISGFFNDEFILGSYLTRFTPILIALFFYLKNNRQKYSIILISGLSFFTVLISGERTALGISLFFYISLFIFVINLSTKNKLFLTLILVSVLTLTISSSTTLKERYIKTTMLQINAMTENKEDADIGIYNNQHLKHLKVSYQIFKEKPFFGHGNKMFAQICFERYFVPDGRCSTHPHNFLAQILVENGIVGGVIYLALFFCLIIYFFNDYKNKNKETLTILLICILSLFPFFPSGNFYNNMMSIFLYLPLTMFFALNENKRPR